MKLIYFANTRIPSEKAHGLQIAEMLNAFANNGKTVQFWVPSRYQSNDLLSEISYADYYGLEQPETKYIRFLDELHPFFVRTKTVKPVFYLRNLYTALFFYFRLNHSDVVYTREFIFAAIIFLARSKVIYEIHQIGTNQLSFQMVKFAQWLSLGKLRKMPIVAISSTLRNELTKLGFENVHVAHDGVRASPRIAIPEAPKPEDQCFDVVYTGQLFKEKGIDLIVQAAKELPDISFGIIGGLKEHVASYTQEATELSIKNISFLGHVGPKEVRKHQLSARCLILPQLDDTAQSPMKLFEYMSTGIPIVASATHPILEVLDDNCAVLFEPGDLDGFRDGIAKVLGDTELSQRISKAAYMRVMRDYTWDSRARGIWNWFTEKT